MNKENTKAAETDRLTSYPQSGKLIIG